VTSAARKTSAGGFGAFMKTYLSRRYTVLFYVLLVTMVAVPAIAAFGFAGTIIEFFLAASLLAAIVPMGSARGRRGLFLLAVVLWFARPLATWFDHPVLSATTLGLWTLMGLFAAATALRFAMRANRVDAEHIYAALSAYLLAGIFFGLFYFVLEQIGPGTFSSSGEFSRMSAFYFSFVTLATLGFGDVVPRSDIARGLAIIEGVGGQLFLAVLVARLVSLYSRSKEAD
jgi:hypothetical protein